MLTTLVIIAPIFSLPTPIEDSANVSPFIPTHQSSSQARASVVAHCRSGSCMQPGIDAHDDRTADTVGKSGRGRQRVTACRRCARSRCRLCRKRAKHRRGTIPRATGAPLAPFIEARLYAIANVAMHDALNAITPRFTRYADTGPIDRDASVAAAVLTAAHDAIVGADLGAKSGTDAWYAGEMAAISGTEESLPAFRSAIVQRPLSWRGGRRTV